MKHLLSFSMATLALTPGTAHACSPPPAGSTYERALFAQMEKNKAESEIVVWGVWQASMAADRRAKRMEAAMLASKNPQRAKPVLSYGYIRTINTLRGRESKFLKVWYFWNTPQCFYSPKAGDRGIFYLQRGRRNIEKYLAVAEFEADK
jgi:hypothetical protein